MRHHLATDVRSTIGMDVEEEEEDRLDTWVSDAEAVGTKGRIGTAKAILAFALKVYPDKRSWWRRAAELEKGSWDRELLIWARTVADTERIRMKSVMFARQQGQTSTALETLSMALNKFPKFVEHYMIQGQIHQAAGNIRCSCPKKPTLWILASPLEEADGRSIKARGLLEKARLINLGTGVEERSGGA
ncbi:hypothetical protein D9613_012724 [Agrocybe pediades]|uniref:Uncharacterized protein n=1 Tax=Agrocybe pediades TaxID=84607 RepID=A0A8H4VIV7_9AGAR|nr:hypothetical protein D9613_012724 [Agrocybe pediades]